MKLFTYDNYRTTKIERENYVYMAQIAEMAERFEDMVQFVKAFISSPKEGQSYIVLSEKEKNLFSIAFKTVSASKRNSLRILLSSYSNKDLMDNPVLYNEIDTMASTLKGELTAICEEVVSICHNSTANPNIMPEDKVFFNKMVGDYYRYVAEFASGEERDSISRKAQEAYEIATDAGIKGNLSPVSPCMLGLALNHSVYYYEIVGDADAVCFFGFITI